MAFHRTGMGQERVVSSRPPNKRPDGSSSPCKYCRSDENTPENPLLGRVRIRLHLVCDRHGEYIMVTDEHGERAIKTEVRERVDCNYHKACEAKDKKLRYRRKNPEVKRGAIKALMEDAKAMKGEVQALRALLVSVIADQTSVVSKPGRPLAAPAPAPMPTDREPTIAEIMAGAEPPMFGKHGRLAKQGLDSMGRPATPATSGASTGEHRPITFRDRSYGDIVKELNELQDADGRPGWIVKDDGTVERPPDKGGVSSV